MERSRKREQNRQGPGTNLVTVVNYANVHEVYKGNYSLIFFCVRHITYAWRFIQVVQ